MIPVVSETTGQSDQEVSREMQQKFGAILSELKHHAPFTLVGAATGVICMLLFRHADTGVSHRLFQVFHPAHVVLSAIVTASLFKLYDKHAGLVKIVLIGYFGSVGVATLSDCVLPFFGETILGVAVPVHGAMHEHEDGHEHDAEAESQAHRQEVVDEHSHEDKSPETHAEGVELDAEGGSVRERLHLGFIEDWYVVNPAAFLGIAIAFFWPRTRFPHAGHVLISTWASSFHVLMNTHRELTPTTFLGAFIVLFVAVWLPCCISDIVFPLLFVKSAPLCTHHPHDMEMSS